MILKLLPFLMLAGTAFGQTVKGTWVPVNVPNIPVNVTNVPWFFDKGFQINFMSVDFGQEGDIIAVVHYTLLPLIAPREQMIGGGYQDGDEGGSMGHDYVHPLPLNIECNLQGECGNDPQHMEYPGASDEAPHYLSTDRFGRRKWVTNSIPLNIHDYSIQEVTRHHTKEEDKCNYGEFDCKHYLAEHAFNFPNQKYFAEFRVRYDGEVSVLNMEPEDAIRVLTGEAEDTRRERDALLKTIAEQNKRIETLQTYADSVFAESFCHGQTWHYGSRGEIDCGRAMPLLGNVNSDHFIVDISSLSLDEWIEYQHQEYWAGAQPWDYGLRIADQSCFLTNKDGTNSPCPSRLLLPQKSHSASTVTKSPSRK